MSLPGTKKKGEKIPAESATNADTVFNLMLDLQRYRCLFTATEKNPAIIEGPVVTGVLALFVVLDRPLTNAEIASRLKNTPNYVSELLKKLRAQKLCEKLPDGSPDNERERPNRITQKGKEQLDLYLGWANGIHLMKAVSQKYLPEGDVKERAVRLCEGIRETLTEMRILPE